MAIIQSFNCQANTFEQEKADSLFATKNYQESMEIYENLLHHEEAFSPAMLLKMAFIEEGRGDFSKASYYLAKYYDTNPNPRVITKIKTLTEQSNLMGYELNDWDRFLNFATDFQLEITASLGVLLLISLLLLIILGKNLKAPKYYIPTFGLILLTFAANNFLDGPNTGIVTGSPTIIMDKPTAGGKLLHNVDPGHRVIIKSSKDNWYEVAWGNEKGYIKKESITKL
ncbi:SH3 domain-containing protein [Belliella sp. DSM 111904]|uniref:SH3 domain-containing protein n=1 Tax=Belliella filtrata TaxID=2923435 RepID=A0ABS9V400_9BACT|nr:SH3 domain-containing protein [Belliella filtrata]MCH7411126.1 SH3 domain-containing protein [Belliella filtrata]